MLIIIKTPLQIICAMEYANSSGIPKDELRFVYLRKYDLADLQVFNTFKFFDIENIEVINFSNSNIIKLFGIRFSSKFILLKLYAKAIQTVTDKFSTSRLIKAITLRSDETVVLGDPNFGLYKKILGFINGRHIVLLDDGLSSMQLKIDFRVNKNIVSSYSFLRTRADLVNESATNSFDRMKSIVNDIDAETILFIGQPLYEAKLCSRKKVEELLEAVGKKFENKKIVYFAHRWEYNLSTFRFPSNFEIFSGQNLPLELLVNQMNPLPHHIVSFYSTALITLKKILPDTVQFSAVNYDFEVMRDAISEAYKKIELYGIKIISV